MLQTAAVIGRNFTEPVLCRVARRSADEIAGILGRLGAAEFIQEVSFDPVEEYRFWHPLTQEVAYGTLLRERRTGLHDAVAEAIVATDPDRLDERAALLATHYERAGNSLEAARWNNRAADFAVRSDLPEAMRRWQVALELIPPEPECRDTLVLGIQARTRLIRYRARTGMDPAETGRLYNEARTMAEASHDPALVAAVTMAYGSTRFWLGAVDEALDLYREGRELALSGGDDAGRTANTASVAVVAAGWVGPAELGAQAIDEVADLLARDIEAGSNVFGYSSHCPLALARAELFCLRSQWADAREALDQGLAVAHLEVATEWVAWLLSVAPRLARTPGEFQASLASVDEAVRLAAECGNTASHVVALGALGIAQVGLGRHSEAVDTLTQALEEARSRQSGLFEEARLLVHLARARLGLGDREGARTTGTEAVDTARRQGARAIETLALLTRARILRATDGPAGDVRADLDAALALAIQMGATGYEAEVEAERAEAASPSQ